ncbi:MAG: Rab family GTPase [Candidatus Hodarchaeota archaeon]
MEKYKIIVAGPGGAGKTTLVWSLGEGEFYDRTTMTVRGQSHLLKLFDEEGKGVELQIFDLAGQEQFFEEERLKNLASDGDAAIVCFDLSDLGSLDDVEKWVSVLPPGIPKILVGTKIDLISEEEVKMTLDDAKEYVEHFKFRGIYSASAKDQESLEKILEIVVDILTK